MHCAQIDARVGEFFQNIRNSARTVVPVNVKCSALAHPELGLLRGSDKGFTILWYEFEPSPLNDRIAPECDEIYACVPQRFQNACVFADLVWNRC